MCGRFTLTATPEQIAEHSGLAEVPSLVPRFNIAPSQPVAVVREMGGQRKLDLLRWGLIPPWASDPSIGNRMINARAETVTEKPAFRQAFRHRRCLIPASVFYEWAKTNGKQPYYFRPKEGGLFAFAGLWERWARGGETSESCTILTTEANEDVSAVHERMPVIIEPADYVDWLPSRSIPERLRDCIRSIPRSIVSSQPVGRGVNDPRHDDANCLTLKKNFNKHIQYFQAAL